MSDIPPKASGDPRSHRLTNSAAAEIDEQYRSRLCQLVEHEMNRRFRGQEDPEDVVQSAFRTFYRRNAAGEFRIDSSADLWRLLVTITRHKILKHVEKLAAAKRSPEREEHREGDGLPGRNPTPEEAVIAADLIEWLLADLDESCGSVFALRVLQSHTEQEVADKLGCSRPQVRAKLERIHDRLERLRTTEARKDDWQPAELAAMLQRCLETHVADYLGPEAPPEAGKGDRRLLPERPEGCCAQ